MPSRRGKGRLAQVIPWALGDGEWPPTANANQSNGGNAEAEAPRQGERRGSSRHGRGVTRQNTVFVGALHGEITAEGLQMIFSELFGTVVYVGIDSDKNSYVDFCFPRIVRFVCSWR